MAMHIHVQGNLAKDPEFHPYGDNNTGVRARLLIARSAKGIMLVQDRIFDRTPPTAVTRRRRHGGTGR